MKEQLIRILDKNVGKGERVYVIVELSANHHQEFEQAVELIRAAKEVGADAVKLQTYTPDTMTLDCDNEYFRVKGTIWEGSNLYQLYQKAYTPWEWYADLKKVTEELGLHFFSTAYDLNSVDFLEGLNIPVYKIASFEIVDIPLLKKVAATGKPIILSTGMSTLDEISNAVSTIQGTGNRQIILLKCTSAYPALPDAMNLLTIPHLEKTFGVPIGLSDHTLDIVIPSVAVSLGACVIEKHLTLSRKVVGPDSAFSLEPNEFRETVIAIRTAEKALGKIHYGATSDEEKTRVFRRSLFVVSDLKKGTQLTDRNIRSIRPGHGLASGYLPEILGRKVIRDVCRGTPLTWDLIE